MTENRIVLPVDVATLREARAVCTQLAPHVGVLKIGLELFTAEGPAAIALGAEFGRPVFLDLKLHDIPETVERSVAAAARHGVRYLTVHATGGEEMLRRAVACAREASRGTMTVLAVTVLTSLVEDDLRSAGVTRSAMDQVKALAELAYRAGVRGFVCSPLEVSELRSTLGREATLVVPGVRPEGVDAGDQKRVATPRDAIAAGADLLVIGRPIRNAADPAAMAQHITREIDAAISLRPG